MLIDRPGARWLLPIATVAVAWAGSVYTPWAQDTAPRLWLYDLVYYLRFVLGTLWLAVVLRLAWTKPSKRAAAAPVLATVLAVSAFIVFTDGIGLRLRVAASAKALADASRQPDGQTRRRVGHLLVDGISRPCDRAQPWLWLGRPHGAGTGTGVALVHSPGAAPRIPAEGSYRARAVTDDWWAVRQLGGSRPTPRCVAARADRGPAFRGPCG